MGELFKLLKIREGGKFWKTHILTFSFCGPLLAFGQSIIFNLFVGFSGALVKTNFPKTINPPAGGNHFFEKFVNPCSKLMKFLKLTGPGQSITGKFVVGCLGGLEKTNFPKNLNPPAEGEFFFGIFVKSLLKSW